jgi:hypothetical protein
VVAANGLAGIRGLKKVVRPDKKGFITLGTATNPPTAGVDLTVTLPGGKSGGKARASVKRPKGKKKAVLLGHAKIAIPAKSKRVLKVKLKPKALALLKKGPLHASLRVVATAVGGGKKSKTQKLTIKPRKTSGKRHAHR